MKKILFSVLTALFLASCGSTSSVDTASADGAAAQSVKSAKASASDKNLYKGAGLVIAVTAPEVRNGSKGDDWMPQFFQDSITGNFAKYSKMTVLDRANENLTKAEQELSESGFYTEENAVQLGQMTNAQYAVFGSILALSGGYELNFRAIDIATNEIKAAYNERADRVAIESGASVSAVVQSLLEGLGIQLSEKEKASLSKTDSKSVNATKSLAKGAAAQKADNLIEALAFYTEAQQNGATKKEANAGINGILGTDGTVSSSSIANLKAQAEYEKRQVEKWEKIFKELELYILGNLVIAVYDFSKVETKLLPAQSSYDSPWYNDDTASFTIAPGVKVLPDRKVLQITQQVAKEWDKVCNTVINSNWVNKVKGREVIQKVGGQNAIADFKITVPINVYDETGYRIESKMPFGRPMYVRYSDYPTYTSFYWHGNSHGVIYIDNLKTQKLYFSSTPYEQLKVYALLKNLPDEGDVQFKIDENNLGATDGHKVRIMSIDEYNEWAKMQ